jgi:hypothetical protein
MVYNKKECDMGVGLKFGKRELLYVFAVMVSFELLLVAGFLIEQASGNSSWTIHRLLNVDAEDSIATWLSTLQLAVVGILIALSLLRRDRSRDPAGWFVVMVGGLFLAMSIDEALQLHEAVTAWARRNDVGGSELGYQAVLLVPVFLVGLLLLALSLRQVARLYRYHPRALAMMVAGVGAFFGGAVGVDLVAHVFLHGGGAIYTFAAAVEEFLELLGGTLMILGAAQFSLAPPKQVKPVRIDAQSPAAVRRAA